MTSLLMDQRYVSFSTGGTEQQEQGSARRARVQTRRKGGKAIWNILSEYGIFSSILRVPITFPPEKLRGVLLSAMCVPSRLQRMLSS